MNESATVLDVEADLFRCRKPVYISALGIHTNGGMCIAEVNPTI